MRSVTPRGFRDILPEEAQWREQIVRKAEDTFAHWGYPPIETPILEDLDVMKQAGELSETPFRLFDSDGRLLIVRPDVTLPIARMCSTRLADVRKPQRFRYTAPVFREQESLRGGARQFTQMGVELVGACGSVADSEVISMVDDVLYELGLENFTITLGSVEPLLALLNACGASESVREEIYHCYHSSNFVELDMVVDAAGIAQPFAAALTGLARLHGGIEVIDQLSTMMSECGCLEVSQVHKLREIYSIVHGGGYGDNLAFDFSVVSSFGYYSGFVFQVYAPGVPGAIGAGGRYDNVYAQFGEDTPAAGFALSLESLQTALTHAQIKRELVDAPILIGGHYPVDVFTAARHMRDERMTTMMASNIGPDLSVDDLMEEASSLSIPIVAWMEDDNSKTWYVLDENMFDMAEDELTQ